MITFVRDPYRRLVSGWADLVKRCKHQFAIPETCGPGDEDDFGTWAREIVKIDNAELDHHFRPQHLEILDALSLADLQPRCQLIIGKVEKIQSQLPRMRKYVGGERILSREISHRRKSQHKAVGVYFEDDDLRARVHQKFYRDEMLHALIGDDVYFSPVNEHPVEHFKSLIKMDK